MYYINPLVFYIIGLLSNIRLTCTLVASIGGVAWFIGLLVGPIIIDKMTNSADQEESYLKTFWKWMKKSPLIFLICIGLAVVTPSEATMYKMMIASKISTDDVDHIIERLDDVVDSIIESKEQADGSAD